MVDFPFQIGWVAVLTILDVSVRVWLVDWLDDTYMDRSELKGRVESRLSLLFCNALPVARWSDCLKSTVDRKHRRSQVMVHWTIREADCPLEHSVSHRALRVPLGQQIDLP